LTNAVTSGDEGTVSALLANGADVNETTGGGQTALILAVIFGHTSLVKLLVNAGADPQLRDNLGLNAIEWAKRRGSREALEILADTPQSIPAPIVEIEEPVQPVSQAAPPPRETESKVTVSDDEKSRRWLAGLRKRLDEQEVRRSNTNEAVEVQAVESIPPPEPERELEPPPPLVRPAVARIFEVPAEVPPTGGKRKRCPRCNAIYNGDLVSYCAHHIVPLVDADEPIITDTQPKSNVPLFWILVLVTLSGSIVIGTIVSTYLYRSSQATGPSTAAAPTIQK
jgi:Ankyrin repeats (3 copies)